MIADVSRCEWTSIACTNFSNRLEVLAGAAVFRCFYINSFCLFTLDSGEKERQTTYHKALEHQCEIIEQFQRRMVVNSWNFLSCVTADASNAFKFWCFHGENIFYCCGNRKNLIWNHKNLIWNLFKIWILSRQFQVSRVEINLMTTKLWVLQLCQSRCQ